MSHHYITVRSTTIVALVFAAISVFATTPAEAQRWGRGRTPSSGACFYQHANFDGDYFCVATGRSVGRLSNGLNDKISSIRLLGRIEVSVFRNPNYGGRSTRFDRDVSNLRSEGWNDTLSSLRVQRNGFGGGSGDGNVGGGNNRPGDVDRIIRRAYQDLLNREPDQAGLREYRRRMIDDGWSERRVRDAIRSSPEYRKRQD